MFVEIDEGVYVNLEQVRALILRTEIYGSSSVEYYWAFFIREQTEDNYGFIEGKRFTNKEEAVKWFKENIEPHIKDYNNAKIASVGLSYLYDISKNIEAIAVILEEIKEKQEV